MKKLDNAIKTKISTYLNDNDQYIKESGCETIAEYLLSNLNEDSDYWWYLEYDGDDVLTLDDKKMIVDYINNQYNYQIDNE